MVDPPRFATFDTAIGPCAIAWRASGLLATLLPDDTAERTARQMTRRFPDAEPAALRGVAWQAAEQIRLHLRSGRSGLDALPVDLGGLNAFDAAVLRFTRDIPAGETRTYGQVAAGIGAPGAARAVGRALGRNPFPIIIPCHRVLAAGARTGGFSAPGGASTKLRLLEIEGATLVVAPGLFAALPLGGSGRLRA